MGLDLRRLVWIDVDAPEGSTKEGDEDGLRRAFETDAVTEATLCELPPCAFFITPPPP